MKYFVASDHAAIEAKSFTVALLKERGIDVVDLGPFDENRVDYPDYAAKVVHHVLEDLDTHKGILICGSGIGMSIAANRFDGIRAALCHDYYTANICRAHNDANILCFGARIVGLGVIESIVDGWLTGTFEGGRHTCRVEKLGAMR